MSVVLGFYQDANGATFQVSEAVYHSGSGEELVIVHEVIPTTFVRYANKNTKRRGPKLLAVPRAIFDNQYEFAGEYFSFLPDDNFGTFS